MLDREVPGRNIHLPRSHADHSAPSIIRRLHRASFASTPSIRSRCGTTKCCVPRSGQHLRRRGSHGRRARRETGRKYPLHRLHGPQGSAHPPLHAGGRQTAQLPTSRKPKRSRSRASTSSRLRLTSTPRSVILAGLAPTVPAFSMVRTSNMPNSYAHGDTHRYISSSVHPIDA